MPAQPEAFFLPAQPPESGQRFCIYYPSTPGGTPKGLVLYIHPFAEEMNKSRRMAALQARALAQAGFAVLQIDLLGCGDSSGDFGDATWAAWVNDVVQGCQWLRARSPSNHDGMAPTPLWLWGLRAGCLVVVEAASRLSEPCNFLFWQPPAAGKSLLQQFLRLKVAGDMLGGQAKGAMEAMRNQLAQGDSVEIAGYRLSPGLASGLEQAVLTPPPGTTREQRLAWIELSTRQDAALSPISAKLVSEWRESGMDCQSHIVQGPAFWQTLEIEDAPALIDATISALLAPGSTPLPSTAAVADTVIA